MASDKSLFWGINLITTKITIFYCQIPQLSIKISVNIRFLLNSTTTDGKGPNCLLSHDYHEIQLSPFFYLSPLSSKCKCFIYFNRFLFLNVIYLLN